MVNSKQILKEKNKQEIKLQKISEKLKNEKQDHKKTIELLNNQSLTFEKQIEHLVVEKGKFKIYFVFLSKASTLNFIEITECV